MKRYIIGFSVVGAVIALLLAFFFPRPAAAPTYSVAKKPLSVPAHTNTPALSHIFVIMEENNPIGNILSNSAAPYLNSLINKYALATNYWGVTHPSLPNYLALTSGSTDGITTDCNPPGAGCVVNVTNLADELEKAGLSWKEYAESMPSSCYVLNSGLYATKHNPFIYYGDIINNPTRCSDHVVQYSQLSSDLSRPSTTPNFAFITPNLCNDMHDCPVSTGDAWLASEVPKIISSNGLRGSNWLIVITWDEGNSVDNHIAAIFIGPTVKNGFRTNTYYNHYSLLRTIENNWRLPALTANDKSATPINDIFKNS